MLTGVRRFDLAWQHNLDRGDQFINDPRRYILRLKVPVSVISSVTLGFE